MCPPALGVLAGEVHVPRHPLSPGVGGFGRACTDKLTFYPFQREKIYIYIYRQRYIYILYLYRERENIERFVLSGAIPARPVREGGWKWQRFAPAPLAPCPPPQVGTGGHQHPKAINKSNKSVCHSLRTAQRRRPLLPAPALPGGFGGAEGLGDKMMVWGFIGAVMGLVPWDGAASGVGVTLGLPPSPAAAVGSCPCHCQHAWVPQGSCHTQSCLGDNE